METTEITLKTVYDQFKADNINKEHSANFKKLYEYHRYSEATPLKEYIQFIYENTENWFLINNNITERFLKIQKTPINIIIKGQKYPHFASMIDDTIKTELPKKFTKITKHLLKQLKDNNNADDDATTEDTESTAESIPVGSIEQGTNPEETFNDINEQILKYQTEINELKCKNARHVEEKGDLKRLLLNLLDAYQNDMPQEHKNNGLIEFNKYILEKYI
jgi:hypothetical protein